MPEIERVTKRIEIEMSGDTKKYLVSAKQGDKATRFIVAKLLHAGVEYVIPEGMRVVANIRKPDGKHVYNTCSYNGSEVTVELTNQALAAFGTAYCDIEIRTADDTQLVTSVSFTIEIEETIRNENAILSSNEFTDLENRVAGHIKNLDDTEAAVRKAEAARVEVERARVEAETLRDTAETGRVEAEETRTASEAGRVTAETGRNDAEAARADAEAKRVEAEKKRVTAESGRVTAENQRKEAENTRVRNEETRIAQEQTREENTARVLEQLMTHLMDEGNPHKTTAAQVGLGRADNTPDAEKPVSEAQQAAIDLAYQQATGYTNLKISELINGAPDTLDTLGEIAAAMRENENVVEALEEAVGKKADAAEFDTHNHDERYYTEAEVRALLEGKLNVDATAAAATKLAASRNVNGISFNGTGNVNNYAKCSTAAATVGKVVACKGFSLVVGAEITVKFTVTNTAANPTLNVNNTGEKPIYYRGAAIRASALQSNDTHTFRYNGAQWDYTGTIDSNTTYKVATTTADGLMSKGDKAKLDGMVETDNVEAVIKRLIIASHPVGSIEVNTTGANPSTYIGGTWAAWGSGRVPVGVNVYDGDFNTAEKTGGAKSYTHQHVVGNHVHTIDGHAHSINSHTHRINDHQHGMSHSHAVASHSHTVNSHNHTQTMRFQSAYLEAAGGGVKYTDGESVPTNVIYTGSASPGTSGVALNTGTPNVASTDPVGLSTNGSGTINTNGSGALTSNGSGDLTTTESGNNSLQPYITCYMWKRTA